MKIGFIGLGLMGLPMARRLLAAGHEVIAWNRSAGNLRLLAQEGAKAALSPREVMEEAEIVGLCLTSDAAVDSVAGGGDGLFAATKVAGKAIADFSTGSPEAAIRSSRMAADRGMYWCDAPVSGGVPAAEKGALIVLAGGLTDGVVRLQPLFDAVAARVSHMGAAGSGQTTKLCNQLIVSCNMLVMGEAIALARRAGVDVAQLPGALAGGFADSQPLQIFGPRMAAHRFKPELGSVAMMKKDVHLANRLADKLSASLPMLSLAASLYGDESLDPAADISTLIKLHEKGAP